MGGGGAGGFSSASSRDAAQDGNSTALVGAAVSCFALRRILAAETGAPVGLGFSSAAIDS